MRKKRNAEALRTSDREKKPERRKQNTLKEETKCSGKNANVRKSNSMPLLVAIVVVFFSVLNLESRLYFSRNGHISVRVSEIVSPIRLVRLAWAIWSRSFSIVRRKCCSPALETVVRLFQCISHSFPSFHSFDLPFLPLFSPCNHFSGRHSAAAAAMFIGWRCV